MKTKILTVVLIIGCISLAILFQVNYNKISQDKSDKANDIQITYDLFKNSFHSAAVSYENKDLENAWISYGEAKYLASQVVKNIRPLLGEKEQCDLDRILYHLSLIHISGREDGLRRWGLSGLRLQIERSGFSFSASRPPDSLLY